MIYLIITTSIVNKIGIVNYEHRKNRYMDSIKTTLSFIDQTIIKPIIVENNLNHSYLNELDCDVLYTNNNKYNFKEKAVNELLDIKSVIHKYDIKDDDIIIKLTGRYKLLKDTFLKIVINHLDKYDAFVKFFNVCTQQYVYDDCVLGLFAIKCKYLKSFDYDCNKSPECEFASSVRNNIPTSNVMEIQDLGLECCFADDLRFLIV